MVSSRNNRRAVADLRMLVRTRNKKHSRIRAAPDTRLHFRNTPRSHGDGNGGAVRVKVRAGVSGIGEKRSIVMVGKGDNVIAQGVEILHSGSHGILPVADCAVYVEGGFISPESIPINVGVRVGNRESRQLIRLKAQKCSLITRILPRFYFASSNFTELQQYN